MTEHCYWMRGNVLGAEFNVTDVAADCEIGVLVDSGQGGMRVRLADDFPKRQGKTIKLVAQFIGGGCRAFVNDVERLAYKEGNAIVVTPHLLESDKSGRAQKRATVSQRELHAPPQRRRF